MTVVDDINTLAKSDNASKHKGRRAERQKKKIKKAKKRGDNERVAQLKGKRKKTTKQKNQADKRATRSGVEIGKRTTKAGVGLATGNPVGAAVEFI